ncbi:tyrosine lyase ThiH [Desulfobulbus propionicus DSM 2032]|uniref:Tyrosine lyase ThiH n=1 Tax=Desulfobulbus propionicus (strain ATCC 33891 / DSM 2032 / VKM B-1956 / 1pr3) TaxID=577650 RepID=A0A7U3YMF2_DESPD|nr:2-iminoacetate synthase ThiH [Desulfobulbus propionicus]ADW18074.1 tyrosine lyase ThiH [Desulfobulbus propionicus DSM 2032]
MSYFEVVEQYNGFDFAGFFNGVTEAAIERSLAKNNPGAMDFLTLLSPRAAGHLEAMARKAHQLTVQYFGRTIQMFIPLYISNHCNNGCAYCGFNHKNPILRRKLSLEEIEAEAKAIARTGMQHVLFLTGEAHHITPMTYLVDAARLLKRHFASVAIEVYPLAVEEYRQLHEAGVDGMTMFQETYDQAVYKRVHLAGKKMDYHWRLNAPERAAQGGMRVVNLGALLGLAEPRSEIFFTGLHARYLENKFLDTEVAISLPRFNEAEGDFQPDYLVDDRTFVQFMTALRIFLPRAGITISTRENAAFRDRILPLGATRFSAGSSTGVGGYTEIKVEQTPQFEITDNRSVDEVAQAIVAHGYQPIYKDWDRIE